MPLPIVKFRTFQVFFEDRKDLSASATAKSFIAKIVAISQPSAIGPFKRPILNYSNPRPSNSFFNLTKTTFTNYFPKEEAATNY